VHVTTTTLFRGVGPVDKPDDFNVVIGQRTSSRRVEDLHKAMVGVSSSLRFGLAFCEASGPRLVLRTGNDPELIPVEAEDIPLVKQIAQVPRRVLHRTERHADRRVAVRVAARGAGQPEQFDGVGEHADDVVATLVHRCVAPRRVR
jgi:hypothetical protein